MIATPRLRGRPERVFVSVDESTGKSTVSFQPADVSAPLQHEGDAKGDAAMAAARSIAAQHPGCTVHGPHFHAARPTGRTRMRRPPGRPSASPAPDREDREDRTENDE
jgi:hypothetical protein